MKISQQDLIRKYKQDTGLAAYDEEGNVTEGYTEWLEERVSDHFDELNKSSDFIKVKQNDING